MKVKKCVFTMDVFDIGGVQTFVRQYSAYLNKSGSESVIVGYKGNIDDPQNYFKGSLVVEINNSYSYGLYNRFRYGFKYIKVINDLLRDGGVDCIHFSTTWSSLYCLFIPKVWKILRISTFYGAYDLEIKDETVKLFWSGLKDITRKLLQNIVLLSSNKIIVFSKYSRDLLAKHFYRIKLKKVYTIPGFILDSSMLTKNIKNLSKNSDFNILNIGRAVSRKGLKNLMESVKILLDRGLKINLTIASPVTDMVSLGLLDQYEELNLFESVRFFHKVDDKQKNDLYNKADLFVIPSLDLETFGMTIIESFAHGVPVMGTPVGAIPEIIGNFDKRFICKNMSPLTLANRISWYYQLSRKEKMAFRVKSIRFIDKNYLMISHIEELNNVYNAD